MILINGILAIFLKFIIAVAVGMSLVVIFAVILYFNKELVTNGVFFIWSRISKDSYEDYIRRQEAERKFKESKQ